MVVLRDTLWVAAPPGWELTNEEDAEWTRLVAHPLSWTRTVGVPQWWHVLQCCME